MSEDIRTLYGNSLVDEVARKNSEETKIYKLIDNKIVDLELAPVATSGNYNDLSNLPGLPTKIDIGLGNVNNTSDIDKPVSTATRAAINVALNDSKKYADQKIAQLVGSSPETLGTLTDLANALAGSKDIIDNLVTAIGEKAAQADLDAHTGNTTVHITAAERTKWNNKSDFSGSYNDLTNKPAKLTKADIGLANVNNTSDLDKPVSTATTTAIANALNEAKSYADTTSSGNMGQVDTIKENLEDSISTTNTNLSNHTTNTTVHITAAERTKWNNKSDFSGSYNDLTSKPTIGNATITINQNGTKKGSFTLNQTTNGTIELTDDNALYSAGNQLTLEGTAFRFKDYCTTVTDWNTAKTNGFYMGNNATNQPVASGGWFYGIVIAHNNLYMRQILFHFASNADITGTGCQRYERVCHNGTWGTWVETSVKKAVPSDAKFTDTNTWRGVQDNLTSTATDQSLSANQGKVLNDTKFPHSDITVDTDINTLKTTGIYHIKKSGSANLPCSNQGTLTVDFNVGTPYQIFEADDKLTTNYKRIYKNNAWGAWQTRTLTDTTYTHPGYTAKASGLYKVTVDATGHVSAATAVAKADITALGIPSTNTTYNAATTSAAGLMSAADKTKLDGVATGANNYSLPTATTSSLGGVKVGSNISVSSGTISLTKANVTTALGYTPPTADTNTTNTAGSTDTSSKIFLVGATSQAAAPQTYSDNQVYATNGQLNANSMRIAEAVSLVYDSTNKCVNFNFAY